MKFFKSYLVILVFLIIVATSLIGGAVWFKSASAPVTSQSNEITLVIPKGSTAAEIGALLKESGLIKNELAFKIYVQLKGLSGSIQAGEYTLDPSNTLENILTELTSGPSAVWVTIPEGFRREQIAVAFINAFGLIGTDAQSFYDEFILATEGIEGTLFPDTYLFEKQASVGQIVSLLTNTYENKTADLEVGTSELIIASLIEREAYTDEEKPVIAGVIENRITDGMGLNIDATLQYIVANTRCKSIPLECEWWIPPSVADKQLNSPYNTYLYSGLPPAPIANPGLISIEAAVNPENTSYYYYLHDGDGQIHYAETLEEHNENIKSYIR